MAAQGDEAGADREVATLLALFPAYPFLASDTFRTSLVAAVAAGRLVEAVLMARGRPIDLPLRAEEELLCDALRVHAGDELPEGERDRIGREIRETALERAFLARLAPMLATHATIVAPLHRAPPTEDTEERRASESDVRLRDEDHEAPSVRPVARTRDAS